MRYLLTQTKGGYWERPVPEDTADAGFGFAHEWKADGRTRVFYLDSETHIFERAEEFTISSGQEADIRIPEMRSRFYIQRMQVFFEEAEEEEDLYLNQQRLMPGDFVLHSGDVLFLKTVKLIVRKEQVIVQGVRAAYSTGFLETAPPQKPFGSFPVYRRSPRFIKRLPEKRFSIELPGKRETQKKREFFMTVLPPLVMLAVTAAVSFLIGRGIYMVLSVSATGVTVVFSVVKYSYDKRERKEKNRIREKRYTEYIQNRQKELFKAYLYEWEEYQYRYPDITAICRMTKEYSGRIYERMSLDEDFLTAAVGRGTEKTSFQIVGKEQRWDDDEEALMKMGRKVMESFSKLDRPKAVDLKKAYLGLVGEKGKLHEQLNLLTAQLVFFQSYHELRVIMVYDSKYEEEFAWMRWLPHLMLPDVNVAGMVCSRRTRDIVLGSMAQILRERAGRPEREKGERQWEPYYLFVIDEPSLIVNHPVMEYLRTDERKMGLSVIYTGCQYTNLPEYIGTVLAVENFGEGTLLLEEKEYKGQKLKTYDAKGIDFEWLARDLSVMVHERGMRNHIPEEITFFDMYGVRYPEELEIERRWKQNQSLRSLEVPLGMRSEEERLFLNLHERAHGPHGLVAGTTGSGKSELIQSYILSLAVNFHPHEVGFLLIDYKGGGMADLFQGLPHHLGTITNLDGGESVRALVSVKAELSRRQSIFRSCGVNHINDYMKLFRERKAKEPIPHLFMICDEFAELRKEQPDFMKELISAARIGRSLGVHLILATQRPAGVIDEQIWSNSKFKICLRVQSAEDSKEVLKTADAAGIAIPGRAYLQVGNNERYELFQAALCSAAYKKGQESTGDGRIYVLNDLGQGELVNRDLSAGDEETVSEKTQLEAVIEHISEVYEKETGAEVKKPWLPPLKKMLVSPYADRNEALKELCLSICIGVIDIPEKQEQRALTHNFMSGGNLLLVASSGFGKTSFLTTILASLAVRNDVDFLNFYILDYGNSGMIPMKKLPHTAEYISADDGERYRKFKKRMQEEIAGRKRVFAEYGVSSLEAYHRLSAVPLKAIIVAADQFEAVKEMGMEEEEFFTKVTRDGPGLGIYVAAAVTRQNSVRQATLNNFRKKIAGYNFDENETFLAVGRTQYRQKDIRGRVLVKEESVHAAQLYVMVRCDDEKYYEKWEKLIEKIRRRNPGKEAPHIPVLPEELQPFSLQNYADDGSDYVIGLDADEVIGTGFARTASPFVIIGNTGTGKTNLMKVLAARAVVRGRTYIFDAKGMELYHYRTKESVLYVEKAEQMAVFMKEIEEELERRKDFLRRRLGECPEANPRELVCEFPLCTLLIDDLDTFTERFREESGRIAFIIKESAALGVACVITVHAAKPGGLDELSRMVKQAADGIVLSAQGAIPIFPVPSMRELPAPGDGLLFQNGIYRRVRIPKYRKEEI